MEKKMEIKKGPEVKKLTYEELENTAHQLSEQSRQLYTENQKLVQALKEVNAENFFKRLEWLWQIINSTTPYITESFKKDCGVELMNMMTITEEETKEEVKE